MTDFCSTKAGSPWVWFGERAACIVGINYLPRYRCGNFWDDFRREEIEADMRRAATLGLNAVRVPVYWSFLEPEPGQFNPEMFRRFDEFLQIIRPLGLRVMPWLLVGVCTEVSQPAYREGSLYDPKMIEHETRHLKMFVGHYRNEPLILAWDLVDEPYGLDLALGRPELAYPSHERGVAWIRALADAVREADPNHLVTAGLHYAAPMRDWGFPPERVAEALDLMGPGTLPDIAGDWIDAPRQTLLLAYNVVFHRWGKPVLVSEGPMCPDTLASRQRIANLYRVALYACLGEGAAGMFPWVMNDYSAEARRRPPLTEQLSEAVWGIFDATGEPKPAAEALREFASVVRHIEWGAYAPEPPPAGLMLPASYHDGSRDRVAGFNGLYGAYLLAGSAGLSCRMVRESDAAAWPPLLLLPCIRHLRADTWETIARYVHDGGTVYCSIGLFQGLSSQASGMGVVSPLFHELFGVELEGLVRPNEPLTATWEQTGRTFQVSPPGLYLAVQAVGAQTWAAWADDRPAITACRSGRGCAVLATFPVEDLWMEAANPSLADAWEPAMYRKLIPAAGITPDATCGDPMIRLYRWRQPAGGRLLVVVNLSRSSATAEIVCAQPVSALREIRADGAREARSLLTRGGMALRVTLPGCAATLLEMTVKEPPNQAPSP